MCSLLYAQCLTAIFSFLASPLFAATTAQWRFHDTSANAAERTFDGASDWFDENNWTNGLVASGAGVLARFWGTAGGAPNDNWDSSGIRYVKIDRNLTI